METSADQRRNFELWAALGQARDAIAKCRANELRATGSISAIQSAILWIVQHTDEPPTPAEISRWILREPHTVSTLLEKMQKRGFVRKKRDLDRKNLVRIEVTEKGEKAYRQSMENAKVIDGIMSCLTEEEAANLLAYLKKLRSEALERLGGRKLSLPYR